MKRIRVRQYQVIIDEQQANCGVVINVKHYSKIKIKDYNLKYTINYNEQLIVIKNAELSIILQNCDKRLLYYAYKTFRLGIFLGVPNEITQHLNAELEFE